jgi:anti-sigma factor RsiW
VTSHLRHVADDRLLDRYYAERAGDEAGADVSAHLEACPACAARYVEFARFMDDLQSEADAEIEARFPDERLQAARRQIARRLENLGHMARVIAFPGRQSMAALRPSFSRSGARWVAGAAAAGLLVGIALGTYSDRVTARVPAGQSLARTIETAAALTPPVAEPLASSSLDEEAFLQEVELASVGLRTRALMPIDAFTPTVHEVSAQLR